MKFDWTSSRLLHSPNILGSSLSIDNRNVDLLAEDFDVAIRIGPLRDSELITRELLSQHWALHPSIAIRCG